MAMPRIAH